MGVAGSPAGTTWVYLPTCPRNGRRPRGGDPAGWLRRTGLLPRSSVTPPPFLTQLIKPSITLLLRLTAKAWGGREESLPAPRCKPLSGTLSGDMLGVSCRDWHTQWREHTELLLSSVLGRFGYFESSIVSRVGEVGAERTSRLGGGARRERRKDKLGRVFCRRALCPRRSSHCRWQ